MKPSLYLNVQFSQHLSQTFLFPIPVLFPIQDTLHLAVMSLYSLHSRIFLSLTLTNYDILEEPVILQLILPKCLVNAAPASSLHYFCLAINKEFAHRPSGPVPAWPPVSFDSSSSALPCLHLPINRPVLVSWHSAFRDSISLFSISFPSTVDSQTLLLTALWSPTIMTDPHTPTVQGKWRQCKFLCIALVSRWDLHAVPEYSTVTMWFAPGPAHSHPSLLLGLAFFQENLSSFQRKLIFRKKIWV